MSRPESSGELHWGTPVECLITTAPFRISLHVRLYLGGIPALTLFKPLDAWQGARKGMLQMNNQQSIDGKAAYHTPALTSFGTLAAVTLSGSGTMVENNSGPAGMMVMCAGGTMGSAGTKYPCA